MNPLSVLLFWPFMLVGKIMATLQLPAPPSPLNLFPFQNPLQPKQSSYENLEEWEVVRDKNGRIQSIKVHRSAKES